VNTPQIAPFVVDAPSGAGSDLLKPTLPERTGKTERMLGLPWHVRALSSFWTV
jgi:hypothetical protein